MREHDETGPNDVHPVPWMGEGTVPGFPEPHYGGPRRGRFRAAAATLAIAVGLGAGAVAVAQSPHGEHEAQVGVTATQPTADQGSVQQPTVEVVHHEGHDESD